MSEQNVEIVKSIYAGWERGDFSNIDWADPEIEYTVAGPDTGTHKGLEAMGRAWRDWLGAWKDLTVTANEFIDAGDHVVVRQTFTGEGRGSGLPIGEVGGLAAVFTLRDGKVIRFAGHATVEDALAEAGIERGG